MQDKIGTFNVGEARLLKLVMAEEVLRDLEHTCRIREDALFELALCGWTEEAFIEEAYGWSGNHG